MSTNCRDDFVKDICSIRLNRDFKRVYSRGKTAVHPLLVVYSLKNRQNKVRVGITTSKKIGGAVQRNRARRLIREAYRTHRQLIPAGHDLIFVARVRTTKSTAPLVSAAMEEQLIRLFPKA